MKADKDPLEIGTTDDYEKPNIRGLIEEFQEAITGMALWQDRCDLAEDSSWCVWGGQSDDGKKHSKDDDEPAFPWENASDTRIRLCEEKVREADKVCNAGFRRGRWDVVGRETTDAAWGRKMTLVLKWLVFTKMRPMFNRERMLAIDWRNRYGLSISLTEWDTRAELVMQDMDLMALAEMFGLGPVLQPLQEAGINVQEFLAIMEQGGAGNELEVKAYHELRNALDLVMSPAREKEFTDVLRSIFPTCKTSALKRAIRELRETGQTRLPSPSITINRPVRRALMVGDDVFFPAGTRALDEARWIAVREWLSISDLESRSSHPDPDLRWNQEFIDELKEHKGISSTAELIGRRKKTFRWAETSKTIESGVDDVAELYEVVTFYYRSTDEYGIQSLYKTITAPAIYKQSDTSKPDDAATYGWHGLLPYQHGRMPFTEHVFFRESKRLIDQVGIPYLIYTYQNEMKEMRDMRIDAASISILPTVRRHVRDSGKPLLLGPGKPIYEAVRGSTEFMNPPNSRVDLAVSAEAAIRDSAARITGSIEPNMPPPLISLHQEDLVTQYLDEEIDVLTQIFQLAQQYLDEAVVTRVTGAMPQPFTVNREEIQGQFDLDISFDPQEIDGNYALRKLDMITKIVRELDQNAVVDRNRLIELSLNIVDPHYADALVTDPNAAANREVSEEQINLALILTGQEPPMRDGGENAQLRLQVLQAAQQNPSIMQALQQDQIKGMIYENRLKHLSFMLEQQKNAQIGRVGTGSVVPAAG